MNGGRSIRFKRTKQQNSVLLVLRTCCTAEQSAAKCNLQTVGSFLLVLRRYPPRHHVKPRSSARIVFLAGHRKKKRGRHFLNTLDRADTRWENSRPLRLTSVANDVIKSAGDIPKASLDSSLLESFSVCEKSCVCVCVCGWGGGGGGLRALALMRATG